jgi:hypothetical protein
MNNSIKIRSTGRLVSLISMDAMVEWGGVKRGGKRAE